MELQQPLALATLKKARKPIRNVNIEHRGRLTKLERFAVWITDHIGTMGFFLAIFLWTVLWLGWNLLAPAELTFDPYPAFVLWLFISNMVQLLFLPLLMVGQELESRRSDLRAEIDFEINRRAEEENCEILKRLEEQQKEIHQLLKK